MFILAMGVGLMVVEEVSVSNLKSYQYLMSLWWPKSLDLIKSIQCFPVAHDFHRQENVVIPNIGFGSFIAGHAVITSGVMIRRGCLVAAGAVVTRDVDDACIVGGIPARQIGATSQNDMRLGGTEYCDVEYLKLKLREALQPPDLLLFLSQG